MFRRALFVVLPTLLLPLVTYAQVAAVSRVVGVFNIVVGLMLTTALGIYVTGFIMWWIRLGSWPSYRTVAIEALEWAVGILFTLVVLLGIVQFFQRHQQAATYVLSAIVIIALIWIVIYLAANSGGGEKEKKGH
jgi:hypothetical protein